MCRPNLLNDTVTLIAPVTGVEIEVALTRLQLWPLLDGYRGAPKADVAAIVGAALSVQAMMAQDASLIDIEINPLMVRENGAVAADALIRKDLEMTETAIRTRREGAILEVTLDRPKANAIDLHTSRADGRGVSRVSR